MSSKHHFILMCEASCFRCVKAQQTGLHSVLIHEQKIWRLREQRLLSPLHAKEDWTLFWRKMETSGMKLQCVWFCLNTRRVPFQVPIKYSSVTPRKRQTGGHYLQGSRQLQLFLAVPQVLRLGSATHSAQMAFHLSLLKITRTKAQRP